MSQLGDLGLLGVVERVAIKGQLQLLPGEDLAAEGQLLKELVGLGGGQVEVEGR